MIKVVLKGNASSINIRADLVIDRSREIQGLFEDFNGLPEFSFLTEISVFTFKYFIIPFLRINGPQTSDRFKTWVLLKNHFSYHRTQVRVEV